MAGALIRRLSACGFGLALAVSGCGGGSSDGELTLQLFGDAEEATVYEDLLDEYERRTGASIDLINVPDQDAHYAKLSTSFAGGEPPDVFLANFRNFGPYADREALDPVGPRLDADPELEREDFYPQSLQAFTFGGALQCLPQNISSLVTYYNRDLFREAGLAEPPADWTFAQFEMAAARLTVDADGDGAAERYGIGVEPSLVRAAGFVWAAGGEVVDETEDPTRMTLDTPGSRAGLESLIGLREAGWAPTREEAAARPLDERFLDGTLGMFLSSRREVPTFRTIEDFEWDVAPFPAPSSGEPAAVLHSDGYCISRSGDSEAAWDFVRFAAGPDGQAILARGGRTVPSLKVVANSPAFLDDQAPQSARVFLEAIPEIRLLPNAPRWPEVEKAVSLALEQAYYGDATLDETLERIEAETSPLLGTG